MKFTHCHYLLLFVFFLPFLFGISVFAQQPAEKWAIDDFHADITIQADGSAAVTETIVANFGSEQKHGIYREIPTDYRDNNGKRISTPISNIGVTMDGQNVIYAISENSLVSVKIGDPDKLISGTHTYVISYAVSGALRPFADYDEFYWNVTGSEWTVDIKQSSARITLAKDGILQTACYAGLSGSNLNCSSKENSTTTAVFENKPVLFPGDELTVAVGFTKGTFPIVIEYLTSPQPASGPVTGAVFALVLSAGLFFTVRHWGKKGKDFWYRDKAVVEPGQKEEIMSWGDKDTIVVEYDPPKDVRPAEAGVIIDETANTLDISATVVDLAVRGYIHITEISKKWLLGTTDYEFKKIKDPNDSLREYEKLILASLFKLGEDTTVLSSIFHIDKEAGDSADISQLRSRLGKDFGAIRSSLYKDVVEKGYFTQNPSSVRFRYAMIAVLIAIFGVSLTVASFSDLALPTADAAVFLGGLRGLGLSLLVLSIILAVVGAKAMPQRTALGHQLYRHIKGYEIFIDNVEKYRQQFFERQNIFMDVLPYAIIFGATKKLASAMKEMEFQINQPSWYTGAGAFSVVNFANSLSSFSSSLNSAVSSGSGGGGSAGGGAGGGGGSGW